MLVLFGRIYGALIALIVFAVSYWLRLSFFECALIMLLIGVGYGHIQKWLKVLDDRIGELARAARSAWQARWQALRQSRLQGRP
jgi:hypothetical protein